MQKNRKKSLRKMANESILDTSPVGRPSRDSHSIFRCSFIGCTEVTRMGKREQEKWDLLSGQSAVLGLLCILFFAGGLSGSLFAAFADGEGAQELTEYLTDYFHLIGDGTAQRALLPIMWGQLRYLLVVVILGLTAIGVVGIPLLFCVRGFFLSFSVGCFCRVFGSAGLVPGLAIFGLPALLWGPALFLAGFQGLSSAQCLLRRGFGGERCALPFSCAYWLRIALCAGLILLCVGVEYGIVPVLLRAAVGFVL